MNEYNLCLFAVKNVIKQNAWRMPWKWSGDPQQLGEKCSPTAFDISVCTVTDELLVGHNYTGGELVFEPIRDEKRIKRKPIKYTLATAHTEKSTFTRSTSSSSSTSAYSQFDQDSTASRIATQPFRRPSCSIKKNSSGILSRSKYSRSVQEKVKEVQVQCKFMHRMTWAHIYVAALLPDHIANSFFCTQQLSRSLSHRRIDDDVGYSINFLDSKVLTWRNICQNIPSSYTNTSFLSYSFVVSLVSFDYMNEVSFTDCIRKIGLNIFSCCMLPCREVFLIRKSTLVGRCEFNRTISDNFNENCSQPSPTWFSWTGTLRAGTSGLSWHKFGQADGNTEKSWEAHDHVERRQTEVGQVLYQALAPLWAQKEAGKEPLPKDPRLCEKPLLRRSRLRRGTKVTTDFATVLNQIETGRNLKGTRTKGAVKKNGWAQ